MGTTFRGYRTRTDAVVEYTENDRIWWELPLYLNEVDHSPTGFEWGYYGSGPSQLAYAIVRHMFGKMYQTQEKAQEKAQEMYMAFKRDIIAKIKTERWEMQEIDFHAWLMAKEIDPNRDVSIQLPLTDVVTRVRILV